MKGKKEKLTRYERVVAFDYPYMRDGRRSPNPLARLIEEHRRVLAAARAKHRGPVVLVGKSIV